MQFPVLANAVENDYGVVHIKANQRQQRRNHRQIDFNLEDGEYAQRYQYRVEDGDHRPGAIGPLEKR